MSISVAWIRNLKGVEELCFISDSRLSGNGQKWDSCKKIFMLQGDTSILCFTGNTNIGFPLIQQIESAINSHRKSKQGYIDIKDLLGHLINVINNLVSTITLEIKGAYSISDDLINVEFIFGGYSWKDKGFYAWTINYKVHDKCFAANKMITPKSIKKIVFCGDMKKEYEKLFMNRMMSVLGKDSFIQKLQKHDYDFEPLEILRDFLIKADKNSTVGGPIQFAKIYQHLHAVPIGIIWPQVNPKKTVYGRTILEYENTDLVFFNPFTLLNESVPYIKNSEDNNV